MLCTCVVCNTVRNRSGKKWNAVELTRRLPKKTRELLLARGANPSIGVVRIELGNTGSKTTIRRYLKEIEDFDPRSRAARERLNDDLSELIADL
ncbi:DNA-binding protein [Pseudomonas lurida]|uniref:DNA-binding protein n=1 Tax=Pseudomonas lurida TaxID=244566 RepID=UPI0030DB4DFE